MQLLLNEEKEYSNEGLSFSKCSESKGLFWNIYIASTKTSTSTAERAQQQIDAQNEQMGCGRIYNVNDG
jgi:hypothetical protein